ncbi:hypothetical protein LUZ60_012689 [Juncus effusus]|nr:hypothetical protein LUZ60_012689 [Juncus effusus]
MVTEAAGGTETPQTERRSLRPRKRPEETNPQPDGDSDDEVKGRSKRRKIATRSVQKKPKQRDPNNVQPNGEALAAENGEADPVVVMKGKGKARSVKGKGKAAVLPESTVEGGKKGKKQRMVFKGDVPEQEQEGEKGNGEPVIDEEEEEEGAEPMVLNRAVQPRRAQKSKKEEETTEVSFEGEAVVDSEAKSRWPHRYTRKVTGSGDYIEPSEEIRAKKHFLKAKVDNIIYDLGDDVFVKASEGVRDYIGKIVELFEGLDKKKYFTAQWFFRAEDTVIGKRCAEFIDERRVFLSEEKNDNLLDCIVKKVKIVRVKPNIDLDAKRKSIPECDLYYDMSYDVTYSSFANLPPMKKDEEKNEADSSASSSSIISSESNSNNKKGDAGKKTLSLLDLYSGCGGMSTGLCLGSALAGVDLQTLWAVDLNENACQSLQQNHPKTQVRNEKAENFLALLKEWEKICDEYNVRNEHTVNAPGDGEETDDEDADSTPLPKGVFEVQRLLGICWGDPAKTGVEGIKFLVRWKGYGPNDDSWEPIDGLSGAPERIKEFVVSGYKRNILPLPGTVDVICGGPPCQGISGFNRFRNAANPLADEKNKQMPIFMDLVRFLKPKYVLMENVVDIVKFANGFLGRYALGRLVEMEYQARLGLMVAGCYGLPQFRMRVFLWGALPTEVLPQFPLPTHDVIVRGNVPQEFEHHIVALDVNADRSRLLPALVLGDAISDLPEVTNFEKRDEMDYGMDPQTDFQRYIRHTRTEMLDNSFGTEQEPEYKLFDHIPYKLNTDDYERVCQIPKRKNANFRDLKGVKVGPDNICYLDPDIPRPLLASGKPLCPDYAISFIKGRSPKPFGRLWWDETVPTVVTRAEPHNQIILHPLQDRVLTVRENARLQGFPDYYKLSGIVKERYIQVGNAVAVPVGRALGVALGRAASKEITQGPLFTLPEIFTNNAPAQQPGSPGEVEQ